MKKLKFLFLALFAIIVSSALTSCSSDDDEKVDSKGFVGTWNNSGDDDIFVFESDGTFVTYYNERYYLRGEKGDFGTWKATQNVLSFTWKGEYKEDGTKSEYDDPYTDTWEIAELANDIIKLKFLSTSYKYYPHEDPDWEKGEPLTLYRYNK